MTIKDRAARAFNIYLIGVIANVGSVILLWNLRHSGAGGFWIGCAVTAGVVCFEKMLSVAFPKPEKLSTETLNYQYGWIDGWNRCRSAKPDDRVFMRADKIGRTI